MKVNNVSLEKIAFNTKQYPEATLPEIALAGRSNVGKSSFINSMINRINLARTSSKPGKTRTLNFYNIEDKFRFVDLPGYGYAVASKRDIESWGRAINTYLEKRHNLKEIFLIIDFRHPPTTQDREMYDYILSKGFTGYVIATKIDKISKGQHQKHLSEIYKGLNIADKSLVMLYSSEEKLNREEVWENIERIIETA